MINIMIGVLVWILVGNIWVDMLVRVSNGLMVNSPKFNVFARVVTIITWPISIYMFMRGLWVNLEEEIQRNLEENRGDIQDTTEKKEMEMMELDEWQKKIIERLADETSDEEIFKILLEMEMYDEEMDDEENNKK